MVDASPRRFSSAVACAKAAALDAFDSCVVLSVAVGAVGESGCSAIATPGCRGTDTGCDQRNKWNQGSRITTLLSVT